MAIDMGIDLFGGNPKETEFFKAIRNLSVIADEQGVKLKQLILPRDAANSVLQGGVRRHISQ